MVLWAFFVVALLVAGSFLVQSFVLYLRPSVKRKVRAMPVPRRGFLPPELIALEAQFFLSPKRALTEARELLALIDAPIDALANAADLAAFSAALQDAHAHLASKSANQVRASRT